MPHPCRIASGLSSFAGRQALLLFYDSIPSEYLQAALKPDYN